MNAKTIIMLALAFSLGIAAGLNGPPQVIPSHRCPVLIYGPEHQLMQPQKI
jgi:hypothetical protein